MQLKVFPIVGLLLMSPSLAGGASEKTGELRGIKAELVSEVVAVRAGEPFTVGLKVSHDETFHTYWQNPGVVGVPFVFEWTLPAGFTAGPIQWPAPEHVMMFHYPAYGYTRDLLLMVSIQPPANALPTEIPIGLQASWMACGSTCHPGNHRFSLTLPVTDAGKPTASPSAPLFVAARAELPKPLEGWSVAVESAIDDPEIRLRLRVLQEDGRDDVDPATVTFFSSDGQVSSSPAQQWSREVDGSLLMRAPRSEYGPKGQNVLPGVLFCRKGWGRNETPRFMNARPAVAAKK